MLSSSDHMSIRVEISPKEYTFGIFHAGIDIRSLSVTELRSFHFKRPVALKSGSSDL